MSKSMLLHLHSRGLALPLGTRGLTLLTNEASILCLGVRQGKSILLDKNRTECIQDLWSRLVLDRDTTHTVEERACLARSIVVPKSIFLRFTAGLLQTFYRVYAA